MDRVSFIQGSYGDEHPCRYDMEETGGCTLGPSVYNGRHGLRVKIKGQKRWEELFERKKHFKNLR